MMGRGSEGVAARRRAAKRRLRVTDGGRPGQPRWRLSGRPWTHVLTDCAALESGQLPLGTSLDGECRGRSRGGLTTKIHALVDANGNPITLKLSAGQAHDGKSAVDLVDNVGPGQILLADRAYRHRFATPSGCVRRDRFVLQQAGWRIHAPARAPPRRDRALDCGNRAPQHHISGQSPSSARVHPVGAHCCALGAVRSTAPLPRGPPVAIGQSPFARPAPANPDGAQANARPHRRARPGN
jgi:hypothetical protein